MILIKIEEEQSELRAEREAIARELQAIRKMVGDMRARVEAGDSGSATEAGKALADLRVWLKHAKETEVQLERLNRDTARISGSYGLDLDVARDQIGGRMARLRRCCREGDVSEGT